MLKRIEDTGQAGRPGDKLIDAFKVLTRVSSMPSGGFAGIVQELQEADVDERLAIVYGQDGEPNGLAVWDGSDDPECPNLTSLFAVEGYQTAVMRSLRSIHFRDRGITRYRRQRSDRVVKRTWKPTGARLRTQTTKQPEISLTTMLQEFWGADPIPGLWSNDGQTIWNAIADARKNFLARMGRIEGRKVLLAGGRSGGLINDMQTTKPRQIVDAQPIAYALYLSCCNHCDSKNIAYHHIDDLTPVPDPGSMDVGLSIDLWKQARNLPVALAQISNALAPNAQLILADYATVGDREKSASLTKSAPPHPDDWACMFADAGLEIAEYEDQTAHAVKTLDAVLQSIESEDLAGLDYADALNAIVSERDALANGHKCWGVWTLHRETAAAPVIVGDRTERILVMLSGGIDSVYVLWDVLANTDMEVYAHHINFVNVEKREIPEALACRDIIAWLNENVRPVSMTESSADRRQLMYMGFDMLSVGFEAGLAAATERYLNNNQIDYWQVGTCAEERLWSSRWPLVEACIRGAGYPFEPPKYREMPILSKQRQIELMPMELTKMTWGCRRPIWKSGAAEPCRRCKTCIDRASIGLS